MITVEAMEAMVNVLESIVRNACIADFQEIFFGNLQLGIDVRIIFCYNSYTVRHPSVYVADVKAR